MNYGASKMDTTPTGEMIPIEKWGELATLFKDGKIPMPYAQEIFLFDSHVAGTGYIPEIASLAEQIHEGDLLQLCREPENSHDGLAIKVLDAHGKKLGYVPRSWNTIPAHLMDGGKLLFAKVTGKEFVDEWLRIKIQVFLRDY